MRTQHAADLAALQYIIARKLNGQAPTREGLRLAVLAAIREAIHDLKRPLLLKQLDS